MAEEDGMLSCSLCQITFSRKSNLERHKRKFHDKKEDYETSDPEHFVFHSDEDFKTWKLNMEKKTCSQYIVCQSARKNVAGEEVAYYKCHRSGTYNYLKDRKRNVKKHGSVKSGVKCPAKIKVVKTTYFEAVEINVTFYSVHREHTHDPGTLKLSTSEKTLLAGQLAQGIPKKCILKNIQSMYNPSQRLLMTTLKDLHNIRASYKLDDFVVLHENDAKSIDSTVTELRKEQDNPVLIYKPQGEISSEMPEFQKDDFLLGIMNETQLDFFIAYGNNIIRMDSIHGTNIYDIQLTTIMVRDASEEGLPVAILFSNRESTDVYKAFFSAIKERLKTTHISICPKVFMSDVGLAFYNAWESVFGAAEKYLFCPWRVKRAFNGNLYGKIQNPEVRKEVRDELHAMHHEANENILRQMLETCSTKWLSNEQSKVFGEYFQKYYQGRPEQWAYCFRQEVHANTKMKLENWYKAIKYDEPERKVMKQLAIVMNAIRTILLSRVINIHWPEGTTIIEGLQKRHKLSTDIPNDGVIQVKENIWNMPTTERTASILNTYEIRFQNNLCSTNCDLKCDQCYACIHMYSCTCPDNTIVFNMCKHIHKICTLYPQIADDSVTDDLAGDDSVTDDLAGDDSVSDDLQVEHVADDISVDNVVTYNLPAAKSTTDDLLYIANKSLSGEIYTAANQFYIEVHDASIERKKNELLSALHDVISRVNNTNSHQELDIMIKWVNSLKNKV